MRRSMLVVLLAAVAVGGGASVAAGSSPVSVKPARGGTKAGFGVSFRAPDAAGRQGASERFYVVDAGGPTGRRGCVDSATDRVDRASAGARVSVTLASHGGHWCRGTFRGSVSEIVKPFCVGGTCPTFVTSRRMIGTFRFRVH